MFNNKKAFTLIELVFVIVVIGILAASIIPRTRTNPVQEAAINLLSQVRYTQHLAMVDDKYSAAAGSTWYKDRWEIRFDTANNKYSIVSNNNTTYAANPSNQNANMSNIDLNAKYGVSISVTGTECGIAHSSDADIHSISFDNLGRPIAGDLNTLTGAYTGTDVRLVKTSPSDCKVVLTNGSETETITIDPETGYARITS